MGVSTLGGSGTGSFTATGSNSYESKDIFTAPSTANYSYAVTVDFIWPEGCSVLCSDGIQDGSTVNKLGGRAEFLVGPSATIKVLVHGLTAGSKTIVYNYHYLGTLVS